MQANYVQRLRLTFSKTGPTRFIGNLDLARTLERSLNRARIPIAYTQGFNRRPRMSLAAALPLGYTSQCELADIWLAEAMVPEQARKQMMKRIAPGIDVHLVEPVDLSAPALQTITNTSTYHVTLLDAVDNAELQQRIAKMLTAETIIRERRRKRGGQVRQYDLRPLILTLSLNATSELTNIDMQLYLKPSKTGRPDEVLLALGLDPLAARFQRTKITLLS
jgi:radical SAM-linked protein